VGFGDALARRLGVPAERVASPWNGLAHAHTAAPAVALESVDQVEAKAGQLALLSHPGSGSQIAGTRSRWLSVAKTRESILSVLQASGAKPLTF
jgi:3-oxoacyl-[acyl-carrier-protein] synthase III